ncbi:2-C-methyl-D-erythritol 4-phosphate cytidylyltransferase [Alcaligenaceae bacterium]|nr:2-C-methyl-D-erythritol 4-phosphate cytidylyltransferase [Alcaligenaceae bacterium]
MTSSQPRIIAIVPAGGVGARAGTAFPKQYRPLLGKPMLRWAVSALLADARIEQLRVAVAVGDGRAADALRGLPRTVCRPCAGPTRAATVLGALRDAAPAAHDWVLVHDAARPGLPADALARLIDTCLRHGEGGLLAEPVADTVKRAVGDQNRPRVQASVSRDALWLAQTPQMFPAGALRAALEAAEGVEGITDEASAMELAGHQPLLVPGSARNFKVTWPEDFELMESLLNVRMAEPFSGRD